MRAGSAASAQCLAQLCKQEVLRPEKALNFALPYCLQSQSYVALAVPESCIKLYLVKAAVNYDLDPTGHNKETKYI